MNSECGPPKLLKQIRFKEKRYELVSNNFFMYSREPGVCFVKNAPQNIRKLDKKNSKIAKSKNKKYKVLV